MSTKLLQVKETGNEEKKMQEMEEKEAETLYACSQFANVAQWNTLMHVASL